MASSQDPEGASRTLTLTAETADNKDDVKNARPEEQLVLRLRPPNDGPRVTFAADVVDNEHMGRLKSNCCCIYVKPRQWDDPSTWEQDEAETEHCRGHTLTTPTNQESRDSDNNGPCGCR
ncbi:Protein phosphatase inhibitor [Aphelenchoides avenae]|nr:Protein phosphatase inhibitor [Aphelenchus avenae]